MLNNYTFVHVYAAMLKTDFVSARNFTADQHIPPARLNFLLVVHGDEWGGKTKTEAPYHSRYYGTINIPAQNSQAQSIDVNCANLGF